MTDQCRVAAPRWLLDAWIAQVRYENARADDAFLHVMEWGWQQRDASLADELQKAQDEELEACCEWLRQFKPQGYVLSARLRTHRRFKPKSRKQRALDALTQIEDQCLSAELAAEIRNALEELPDD